MNGHGESRSWLIDIPANVENLLDAGAVTQAFMKEVLKTGAEIYESKLDLDFSTRISSKH
jgi:hypothetical protein